MREESGRRQEKREGGKERWEEKEKSRTMWAHEERKEGRKVKSRNYAENSLCRNLLSIVTTVSRSKLRLTPCLNYV